MLAPRPAIRIGAARTLALLLPRAWLALRQASLPTRPG